MMSPHFPEKETNDQSDEDDVFDQHDEFEDPLYSYDYHYNESLYTMYS